MELREFFKPTISKIIVFLAILIAMVPFIQYDNGIRCIMAPCPSDSTGSILTWLFAKRYAGRLIDFNYLFLVIGLAVSYFISCLTLIFLGYFEEPFN